MSTTGFSISNPRVVIMQIVFTYLNELVKGTFLFMKLLYSKFKKEKF